MLDPKPLPSSVKARHAETTIVIKMFTADLSIIDSLITAYSRTLPPKLIDIFEQIHRSIEVPLRTNVGHHPDETH